MRLRREAGGETKDGSEVGNMIHGRPTGRQRVDYVGRAWADPQLRVPLVRLRRRFSQVWAGAMACFVTVGMTGVAAHPFDPGSTLFADILIIAAAVGLAVSVASGLFLNYQLGKAVQHAVDQLWRADRTGTARVAGHTTPPPR